MKFEHQASGSEIDIKPIFKWAGGKSKLIDKIVTYFPADCGSKHRPLSYFEPFVGGGAVFFYLRIHSNMQFFKINDINFELFNAYSAVRDQVEPLIEKLQSFRHSKRFYYEMRKTNPFQMLYVDRAARFIYLNRTCFNGLWRVNSKGGFNVPIGSYKKPIFCDPEALRAASWALQDVSITCQDFEHVIYEAAQKDFVYCDPPYLVEFTKYAKGDFGLEDHERLFQALKKAHKRGVLWMLSQADSPFIRNLFKEFNIIPVAGRTSVGATGERRGESRELLITNYDRFISCPGV